MAALRYRIGNGMLLKMPTMTKETGAGSVGVTPTLAVEVTDPAGEVLWSDSLPVGDEGVQVPGNLDVQPGRRYTLSVTGSVDGIPYDETYAFLAVRRRR